MNINRMSNKVPAGFVNAVNIEDLLQPPASAGSYLGDFLKRINLTPNAAAKKLHVSQSTVKRLIDGGQLSENMAARIKLAFQIDPDLLLKLDAKHRAYKANKLALSKELLLEFEMA